VLAQQRTEVFRVDRDVAALLELAGVLRIFETEPAETGTPVIDAEAVMEETDLRSSQQTRQRKLW
jgi:hypothetical protein